MKPGDGPAAGLQPCELGETQDEAHERHQTIIRCCPTFLRAEKDMRKCEDARSSAEYDALHSLVSRCTSTTEMPQRRARMRFVQEILRLSGAPLKNGVQNINGPTAATPES
jgi:hypothetical protein